MGPLAGIRVIELAGLGPSPFCAMLLADLGADVIRVDRPGSSALFGLERVTCRNRKSLGLDLKEASAVDVLLGLVETADVLIEGMRPGVAERLGIGPEVCAQRNRRLVYSRMTGWGQQGPLADHAGHDINYVALSGALDAIGPADGKPVPPLNLVADFGGGALYLAMGILAALVERESSGQGEVVDAAMVDGAASLMTMFHEFRNMGMWNLERGTNLLDGGVPFYDVYGMSDGGYMAVGALEPKFYVQFVERLGLESVDPATQYDRSTWPELADKFARRFAERTREEWSAVFEGSDSCVTPVLSIDEAPGHPHNVSRGSYVQVDGGTQPAPAPRFSRSVAEAPESAPVAGEHTDEVLAELGFSASQRTDLRSRGAVF